MPNPSNLSFIGIAKETTKGTGAAATAYIPMDTFEPLDNVSYLEDSAMRGSMVDVYNMVAGPIFSEISMGGPAFPDTFPWILANLLGDLVTTVATPNSHAIAVKNSGDGQPGAVSFTDYYGLSGGTPARRFPGCQISELGFKFNADGMLAWSGKTVGLASSTVAKPTSSFGTIPPLPAWLGALQIGGSSKTFIEQGEVNIKRGATAIHTVDGTQAPYAIWVGAPVVDGKLTCVHEDDTELNRYLQATTTSLSFDWSLGAGATAVQIKAVMSKVQYKVASVKRGKAWIETEIDFKAMGNTTDVGASGGYSAIKWTVQNAIGSGIYA